MLEELNRRLMDVKEKMRIKQKLLAALSDIEQKLSAQKSRLAELEKKLRKEGKDVKKLEGLSLTSIFLDILGSREEQLEKERQEYLAAKLRFDECQDAISALAEQLAAVNQKLSQFKDTDREYEAVFKEKEKFILNESNDYSREIIRFSEDIADTQSNIRELEEAITAGNLVLAEINEVIDSLRDAKDWGTWDLLVGGLISTAIKHSKIDKARDAVHRVQQKLIIFLRELKDVDPYLGPGVSIDIGSLVTFADYFFDGLIIDWVVQSRIKNSLANVVSQRQKVAEALDSLEKALGKSQQELDRLTREKQILIENIGA
jgi:chromosome segregation ATPase